MKSVFILWPFFCPIFECFYVFSKTHSFFSETINRFIFGILLDMNFYKSGCFKFFETSWEDTWIDPIKCFFDIRKTHTSFRDGFDDEEDPFFSNQRKYFADICDLRWFHKRKINSIEFILNIIWNFSNFLYNSCN